MKKIEKLLEEEKKEEIEFQEFRKENAKLRDRVQVEITESVIKKLFKNNVQYLKVNLLNLNIYLFRLFDA